MVITELDTDFGGDEKNGSANEEDVVHRPHGLDDERGASAPVTNGQRRGPGRHPWAHRLGAGRLDRRGSWSRGG